MKRQQDGYILVLTLVVLGLVVIIASQLFYLSSGFTSFARVSVRREKAKLLALSGVRIAQAQLFIQAEQKKQAGPGQAGPGQAGPEQTATSESQEQGKGKPATQNKASAESKNNLRLLKQVLPILNTWQTTTFTEKKDGFTGSVKTYVSCEDGKISLNVLLGMMTQKGLQKKQKDILVTLWKLIGKSAGAKGDLFALATDFFERRNKVWLNDVTELLDARGFQFFDGHVFVHMPNSKKSDKKNVYLTDIFTPQSRYAKLDPWVFSASVRAILGLKPRQDSPAKVKTPELDKLLKEGKTQFNWKQDWDKYLKPLYGKEFKSLPKDIDLILAPQFNPVAFSVVSYGIVQDVAQGVYAVFSRKKDQSGNVIFVPIKIYWL